MGNKRDHFFTLSIHLGSSSKPALFTLYTLCLILNAHRDLIVQHTVACYLFHFASYLLQIIGGNKLPSTYMYVIFKYLFWLVSDSSFERSYFKKIIKITIMYFHGY